MAWTNDIDWLDGETISELKLDQMVQNIEYVKDYIVPSGGIIIWSGSAGSIPSGWYLCDGNNGTPNLVDRFVVGAGSTYAVGATGGATTHLHAVDIQSGNESDTASVTDDGDDQTTIADNNHHHHVQGNTASASSLPPYYALCYIMKA